MAGQVNVEYSRIYVFVDKSGVVGHQHAVEGKLAQGRIYSKSLEPGSLVFDMNSFDADTDLARKYIGLDGTTDESTRSQVNANMRGASILHVKKYREARLENVRLQPRQTTSKRGLAEYLLTGNFTLHEKTRPVEIVVDMESAQGWNHLRGSFTVLQSNFGIKPFSKMLGAVGVKDELTIYGDLWIAPE